MGFGSKFGTTQPEDKKKSTKSPRKKMFSEKPRRVFVASLDGSEAFDNSSQPISRMVWPLHGVQNVRIVVLFRSRVSNRCFQIKLDGSTHDGGTTCHKHDTKMNLHVFW